MLNSYRCFGFRVFLRKGVYLPNRTKTSDFYFCLVCSDLMSMSRRSPPRQHGVILNWINEDSAPSCPIVPKSKATLNFDWPL